MIFSKIILNTLIIGSIFQSTLIGVMPDRCIESPLFVVNKNYKLSEYYSPDITTISAYGVTRNIREDMLYPLQNLIDIAKEDGVDLHIVSAYRSYNKQNQVFSKKASKVGADDAAELVAIPGTSEHQLGLAADISYDNWMGINEQMEKSKQGKWLRANVYDNGFIIRYLREYEDVTGYSYEPWHIRYIGTADAKKIQELDEIPLEYYVSRLRKDKYTTMLNKDKLWDYPVNMKALLSIYNADSESIKKDAENLQTQNVDGLILENKVAKAFIELKSLARKNNIDFDTLSLAGMDENNHPSIIYLNSDSPHKFLKENSYKYGFVYENNTIRYYGLEIANYIYENKLSQEEFKKEWKNFLRKYTLDNNL